MSSAESSPPSLPPTDARPVRRWIPFVCLAGVVAIFFARDSGTLYYDDLPYWFYPWKVLIRRTALEGHVPLWLPWEFGGMPHLGDIQRQLLYPPAIIFRFVETPQAMVWFVGFHIFAAGACMMALLQTLDEDAGLPAILCGGIVYAFCAFPILHSSQLPQLASYSWVPLLVLACARCREGASFRWISLGGAALALMIYGGAPQAVYIAACLVILFQFGWLIERRGEGWRAALLASVAMLVLGLGLAAAQLLPFAQFASHTMRASSTVETTSPAPLPATLLSPYARGNPHERTWNGEYNFHETCLYLGLVTLVLAASAFTAGRRAWLLGVIGGLGLGLALGPRLGTAYEMLATFVPGFGLFRVATRWTLLTAVAAACLACAGTTQLTRSSRARLVAGGTALLIIGGALAIGGVSPLALGATTLAAVAALAAQRFSRAAPGVIALALVLDLVVGFASRYVVFSVPPQPTRDYPPLATLPAQTNDGSRVVGSASMGVPSGLQAWLPVFGVASVQGSNPLYLRNYVDYLYFSQTGQMPGPIESSIQEHNGLFPMATQNAMTRMLNVSFRIRGQGGESGTDALGHVSEMLTLEVGDADDPCGVAWTATRHAVVADHAERLQKMFAEDFDPRDTVLLDEDPGHPNSGAAVSSVIKLVVHDAEHVAVNAKMSRDAWVVFSEVDYPGWTCTIDEKTTRIHRANDVLRAVWVPQGEHTVEMRFYPRTLYVGTAISLVTMLFMAVATVLSRRRTPEA